MKGKVFLSFVLAVGLSVGCTFAQKAAPIETVERLDVTMVPVRTTLEAMGYELQWLSKEKTVIVKKEAFETAIVMDKNQYGDSGMALSQSPYGAAGKSYVPIEYLQAVLQEPIVVSEGRVYRSEGANRIHEGIVETVTVDSDGTLSLKLVKSLEDTATESALIVHTSLETTFYQKALVEGESVKIVAPDFMTTGVPPQTPGYIIY